MNRKRGLKDIGFYILIFVILMITISVLFSNDKTESIKYSQVVEFFESEQVKSFVVEDSTLTLTLKQEYNGKDTVVYNLYSANIFYNDLGDLIKEQHDAGIIEDYDYTPGPQTPWWVSFVPYIVIMIIFMLVWYLMMNKAGGGGAGGVMKFSKARTRLGSDEKKKVTFKDVAGADEEKAELEEIVDFLKNPKKFIDIGARIPKGVLLVGPPGTGKTLIAKAVAGEAGVQFLSISGSDFVELYVGVGAGRVRDLFEQAKKASPSIIFIDEIDAVGRRRGAGLGGGHDEREQTLNQLLVEMDGFGNNEGVVVMAATNRADILDPALMRPGRFDRQIFVGLPDSRGREAILKVHSREKPLADDVNLGTIAKGTPGFTGADLENLLNEAALLAARNNRRVITQPDIEEAIIKVIAGPAKKSRVVSEHERRLAAYHEAGHAVAMRALPSQDPVHQITIIPRGGAGGMTISLPKEDKSFMSKLEMCDRIVGLLGGRVAEKLVLNDISTGASNDIQRATAIARNMVAKYGMSDKLGSVAFDSHDEVFIGRDFGQTKAYSEEIAAEIDREIRKFVDEAYARCETILREHMDILKLVAEYLLENDTMTGEEFELCFTTRKNPSGERIKEGQRGCDAPDVIAMPGEISETIQVEEPENEASETESSETE
ncbi:MAG: ATP-dependent zinc metalloprotease FtsH [Oscillospiraceae bacterium]|nr:ATP-dependent zinc metalloprotease FtsH [Oscillospiraceae bacterium]